MKKLFIVANWKSNKDSIQVKDWIERFTNYDLRFMNKDVIICPSFVHLSILKSYILNHKSEIMLGVQDISPFDEGAYTGSVNAKQASEFAQYAIIGHSERREKFNETDELINQKIEMAIKYSLIPILCVSDIKQVQSSPALLDKVQNGNSKLIVAYELPSAIGTGIPDTPENADAIAKIVKEKYGTQYVLYGASVNSNNVKSFTQMPNIDGVLVGGASLDPLEFYKIVELA